MQEEKSFRPERQNGFHEILGNIHAGQFVLKNDAVGSGVQHAARVFHGADASCGQDGDGGGNFFNEFSVTAGLAWRVCGSALLMQTNSASRSMAVSSSFRVWTSIITSSPSPEAMRYRSSRSFSGRAAATRLTASAPETIAWQIMAGWMKRRAP